ncbi:MAG: autotransporter-associated beta strand repeat-containing protein, partial [Verrucomicrobiota bacterium]
MKYKIETPIFTGLDRWGTLGACLFLSVARLGAADLTWDIDPFTAGAQDGAGTWDSSAASWWDGTGSSIWNSAAPDNATFGTGLDLAGNFNVNLGEDITVGNLSFANLSANVGFGNTYTLMGGKTLTLMNAPIVNVADNAVIAVPLVGTAGFTKTGAGTLRISADSPNFSGTVTNSAGRLQLGNNSSTGNLGAANIVNFDRFAIRRSNAFTVSNAISGPGAMSLELNAATALTVAPASGWTYTGSTTIAPTSGGVVGGRVLLGLNDGLPVGTALTMNLNGASLVTFDLNGFDQTIGSLASGAGATVNSVVVTNRSAALSTLTVSNGLNTTFAGLLAGNLNLVKAGTNTLLLSGANTYTGDTTVSGGTLKLGVTNAIPDGASAGIVVVTQSGVLDLGGRSGEVINALAGDGVVNNTTGTGTYSLNVGSTAAATNTFSGVIQNSTGIVRLYKVGATTANVLKLTGSNTFTGDVHVNGGQLWVGNSQALGLGAKGV